MSSKKRQTMAEIISHKLRSDAKEKLKSTSMVDESTIPHDFSSDGPINILRAAQTDSQTKIDNIELELTILDRRKEYLLLEKEAYSALLKIGNKYIPQLNAIKKTFTSTGTK